VLGVDIIVNVLSLAGAGVPIDNNAVGFVLPIPLLSLDACKINGGYVENTILYID
jgi:hypothetical protein